MAERRMFTKKVTDDDNFMGLSSSAQALYLHLSMSADDDGFCNQVTVSMFKAHASVEDLRSLLEKRYVYQFDNGVIVIKHWRMANALRKDRYTPTTFQEELSRLGVNENGSYSLLPDGCQLVAERLPDGCQLVAECLPQDRLGKDRLDKDKILCVSDKSENASPALACDVITYLNEKTGKKYSATSKPTAKLISARSADGHGYEDFVKVIDNKVAAWGNDPKMAEYLRPSTLFAASHFEEYLNEIPKAPNTSATIYHNPENSLDYWDKIASEFASN